ncbi:ATP-binding protein [Streptomyces sp. WM6378]|uniref:ATP-binding protein n=1 Tax=Streptomyces sp. WM6378 TaxID=1415557 RepID=UPI0006B0390A|nr:ATP-binding protein [Streptomyces sp. WM6378]KOU37624.1 hypothetical protein ADK54_31420 [Streptomyces sp. WM6378]
MRIGIRHIIDHLVWSADGTAWAVFRVAPEGSRYMGARQRNDLIDRVTTLARSLPHAARVYSLCAQLDPGEVVARTLDGVDTARHPYWAEVADARLRLLAGPELVTPLEMHRRTWWLAVPVSTAGAWAKASAALGTAWSEVAGVLGLRQAPVSAGEVEQARQAADQLAADLGGSLGLHPARPAEIAWMFQHAIARGAEEPLLSEARAQGLYGGQVRDGVVRSPSYADLVQAVLLEGGREDGAVKPPANRARRKAGVPVGRRWLQVSSEFGLGYQAQLAVAQLPRAVLAQDADFLAQLERLPFPVDFTCDLKILPTETVLAQITKAKRNLVDQAEQYSAQQATGVPEHMHDHADDLGDMDARASRGQGVEVEVQSVTVITVWAPTSEECDRRARAVTAALRATSRRLARPVGLQEDLFALTVPASSTPPRTAEFTQHQFSEGWAMNGAFTGCEFGDERGQMIGVSLESGTVQPVLLDFADAPVQDASASFGVVGDLGGGKSVFSKEIASGIVDRGGRVIAIDRTPMREWAAFAHSAAPGRCQVIDAAKAQLSIDPLRIFPRGVGAHYALSYLTLQLGIGPMTAHGAVLKRAVDVAAASSFPCMAAVISALEEMAMDGGGSRSQGATTLCDLLQVVADNPLGAAVFDPELPPAQLDGAGSDFVVITTAGLTLPPAAAVRSAELLRTQPLESLIGRAVLYLIAALARQVAFTDRDRFCLIHVDECYWLTGSAEGMALVHEIVHDGRKHAAGIGLVGHDRDDLGDEETRGLLAYRFVARTADPVLAARALAFLGLPAGDEDLLRIVTTELSPVGAKDRAGELLGRDPRMRISRFQVLVPELARLLDAIFTSPSSPTAGERPGRAAPMDRAAGLVRSTGGR